MVDKNKPQSEKRGGWLSRFAPGVRKIVSRRDTPDNLWVRCPGCEEMLFTREYEENLSVCPRCEHHGRINADRRLKMLLDEGFEVLPVPEVQEDPLKFRDSKKYTDRLKQARAKSPHRDAFVVGSGSVKGRPAVIGVQDFSFMGGSWAWRWEPPSAAGLTRRSSGAAPMWW